MYVPMQEDLDDFRQHFTSEGVLPSVRPTSLRDAGLRWWCFIAARRFYALKGHLQGVIRCVLRVDFEGGRYLS